MDIPQKANKAYRFLSKNKAKIDEQLKITKMTCHQNCIKYYSILLLKQPIHLKNKQKLVRKKTYLSAILFNIFEILNFSRGFEKISKYYLHLSHLAPYIRSIRTRFCRLKSVHRSMWRDLFQTNLMMLSAVLQQSLTCQDKKFCTKEKI